MDGEVQEDGFKLFKSIFKSKDHYFSGKTNNSNVIPSNSKTRNFISEDEKMELVELFGLSSLLDKHPYDCSGGEQQKIAIVKALLTNPDILFLDEPTKGIDPVSKLYLADLMKKLQKEGLTIVMTTHD
nr:ATP-binding cassette domain-containing protein [Methanobacterium sp.]